MKKLPSDEKKLRSHDWFGKDDKMGFVHRSWLRNQGYPDDYFRGRPVIGICNTWSELTPCNGHLRDFAEIVKRGVAEAGGFPLEFPVTYVHRRRSDAARTSTKTTSRFAVATKLPPPATNASCSSAV